MSRWPSHRPAPAGPSTCSQQNCPGHQPSLGAPPRSTALPSPPGLRTPPPKKYNDRTTHTTPPPRQSAPGKTHFHNKHIYRRVPARVCSTGASIRPAVQALPAAYEYPAAQDPTQHAAPERSQAAAQPAHTDAPTNTPQTPRRPVSSLHTHTHTTPTPASPPPRASGCACITLRKPPKQAKADLSGHQKRPINRMHHSIARPVRRRVDSPASASHQRQSALAPALSRRQPRSRCGARRLQVHAAPAHTVREAAAHASDAARTRREGGPAHERQ